VSAIGYAILICRQPQHKEELCLKVLLYFEGEKLLAKSGIGRALAHQQRALTDVGIDYTLDRHAEDYDILHINTYGVNSLHMVNKAKRHGKKVIYHAHSTEEDFRNSFIGSNQLSPLYKKYLINLYARADQLITPTPYSKELLTGYGLTVPIKAISNGIDLAKYQPNAEKEQAFRNYFQIDPDQKVIISVGLFFERKGILDFVEIAKQLPEYTFIWFGHTPMMTIPKKIRDLVNGDHPSNVRFPGYIKGDIIEGAYSGADLFFFPSYEETEGIVVLEALASKQQILVRDIPVYQGWLKDGQNSYMGRNNLEFAAKIKALLNNELPDLTDAGYRTAQEKSIDAIGKELQSVYQEVLTKN